MKIAFYETNLTDAQWALLQPLLPTPSKLGRPPTDRRQVINSILYIVKGGIPWRLLPHEFPPWKTVHSIFRKWTLDRTWETLNDRLRALVREQEDKRCRPTAAILDSQSVKSWHTRILLRLTIQLSLVTFAKMKSGVTLSFPPNVPIWVDPERMSGAPCFKGTRVPVSSLFTNLESGLSLEEYLDCFPDVTREQAVAVLEYAHKLTLQPAA